MADIPYNLVAQGWAEGAASVQEFGASLSEASKKADEFGEAADDAKSDSAGFKSALNELGTVVGVVAGAIAAATGAAALWADESERVNGIFNRTEGSVAAAQEAVGGLVSQLDLVTARNRLIQAGLRLSNRDFAAVAEVATDYSAAVGESAAPALERLGQALIRTNARGLQGFGVELQAGQTRAQQFASAMEQLRRRSDEMATGADTAGGRLGVLSAAFDDLKTRAALATAVIAQEMLPAFGELAGAIAGTTAETITWNDVTQTADDLFVSFTSAALAGLETMISTVAELINRIRDLGSAAGAAFAIIREDGLSGLTREAIARRTGPLLGDLEFSIADTFSRALERNLDAVVADRRGGGTSDVATTIATQDPGRSGGGRRDLRTAAEQMSDAFATMEGEAEAARLLEEQARSANEAMLSARFALDAWSDSLDKAAEGARLAAEETRRLHEQQKTLEENAARAADTFRDSWRNGVDAVIEALQEANEAAAKAGTAQVSAMEAAGQAALAASKQMGDALLGGVANAFAGAVKAAVRGEKGFGEALAGMLEETLFSIGTQALVLSLFEFGKAVADAASLNAAGAAAHAAAGATFAAVAALAFAGGAGLAAANPGSAASAGGGASAPASPQPANDNASGGSVTNVTVVFGGQVVTAATHAELGRQVESSIEQSRSRWGRAA